MSFLTDIAKKAGEYIGVHEEGGENRGTEVEEILRSANLQAGNNWGAAFANTVIEQVSGKNFSYGTVKGLEADAKTRGAWASAQDMKDHKAYLQVGSMIVLHGQKTDAVSIVEEYDPKTGKATIITGNRGNQVVREEINLGSYEDGNFGAEADKRFAGVIDPLKLATGRDSIRKPPPEHQPAPAQRQSSIPVESIQINESAPGKAPVGRKGEEGDKKLNSYEFLHDNTHGLEVLNAAKRWQAMTTLGDLNGDKQLDQTEMSKLATAAYHHMKKAGKPHEFDALLANGKLTAQELGEMVKTAQDHGMTIQDVQNTQATPIAVVSTVTRREGHYH